MSKKILLLSLALVLSFAAYLPAPAFAQGGPWNIDNDGFAVDTHGHGGGPGGGGPGTGEDPPDDDGGLSFWDVAGLCGSLICGQVPYSFCFWMITGKSPLECVCECIGIDF